MRRDGAPWQDGDNSTQVARDPIGAPSRGRPELVRLFNELELPFDPYLNLGLTRGADMLRHLGAADSTLSVTFIDPITGRRLKGGDWGRPATEGLLHLEHIGSKAIQDHLVIERFNEIVGRLLSSVLFPSVFRTDRTFPCYVRLQACSMPDVSDNATKSSPVRCHLKCMRDPIISTEGERIFSDELFKVFRRACDVLIPADVLELLEAQDYFGGFVLDYTWSLKVRQNVAPYLISPSNNASLGGTIGIPTEIALAALDVLRGHLEEFETIGKEVFLFDLLPMLAVTRAGSVSHLSFYENFFVESRPLELKRVELESLSAVSSSEHDGVSDLIDFCKERFSARCSSYFYREVYHELLRKVPNCLRHLAGVGFSFSMDRE